LSKGRGLSTSFQRANSLLKPKAQSEGNMKTVLSIVGLIAILFGLHWIGQGTGVFIWPANPVMDNHIAWAYGGAAVAILGVLIVLYARRRA
jgi:hypothetical protein